VVEIDGNTLRLTPIGADGKIIPRDANNRPLPSELEIRQ
jgi:hypothetical protein